MSKFKVGDKVTTTATHCAFMPEDKIDNSRPLVVLGDCESWTPGYYCVSYEDIAADDVDVAFKVHSSNLSLADDPDEGGQHKRGQEKQEGDEKQEEQEGKQEDDTHADLKRVFALAVAQSQSGKGADRHGNGEQFRSQPIVTINQALGSNHGALFQVVKKATESARLAATDRKDMAKNELLGAMVYAAAAYLLLEE